VVILHQEEGEGTQTVACKQKEKKTEGSKKVCLGERLKGQRTTSHLTKQENPSHFRPGETSEETHVSRSGSRKGRSAFLPMSGGDKSFFHSIEEKEGKVPHVHGKKKRGGRGGLNFSQGNDTEGAIGGGGSLIEKNAGKGCFS